jgi:uncharacterized protein (DUF924 family)
MEIIDQNYEKILNFWFNKKVASKRFIKNQKFDTEIRKSFLPIYKKLIEIVPSQKIDDIKKLIALIILFDQFPRNMFRGNASAFASDQLAINLTKYGIKNKLTKNFTDKDYLLFFYMPLMHSEDLQDQELSVSIFRDINQSSYEFAIEHRDIIQRFGRFPHRNEVLKRKSTDEEIIFLKNFTSF